jgi:transposase
MKEWIVIHKIKALYDNGKGLSKRRIAIELGISRNSVSKYLSMEATAISEQQEESERTKILDAYQEYIVHLLQSYPALSAVKILRKLKDKYPDMTISGRTVRRYVERLKGSIHCKQKRYYQPVLDMVPGVQCQVDPGELRGVMVGGIETTVYFVVFVLSYSRMMYVGLSPTPINTEILIKMHDAAFRYFGGCVEECVYDQTKMVILEEEYRELTLNRRFHEYAMYAGFSIRACEGCDPESKGKVEAGVKYVKQNALYGEIFSNWAELETYQANWLDTIANERCHGTTGEAPKTRYERLEKRHMRAYNAPSIVQPDSQWVRRKVDKTGLIAWQSNKYSVPMAYQGAVIGIQAQDNALIIYDIAHHHEIARHGIATGKGKVIQNRNHYRDLNQLVSELETKIIEKLGDESGAKLCHLLKITSPAIYKDQLRGVIQILSAIKTPLDPEIINRLCQRQRLTARAIKEYLAAYVAKQNNAEALKKTNQALPHLEPLAQLSCYQKVLQQNGGDYDAVH